MRIIHDGLAVSYVFCMGKTNKGYELLESFGNETEKGIDAM